MLKMATYPGMSLGGEVRESISLDEDDLSDVEDEVFIRDGKNSYKLAEELNVKRPLMAPRSRKLGKPELTSRLKTKANCRVFCRPFCYIFAALVVILCLIAIAIVLISIFPLPLDKLRNLISSKQQNQIFNKKTLLSCTQLETTDVWSATFPVLTTDSPIRLLDVNSDGTDDVIFGFGTGTNYNKLPPDIFCPIFLNVAPPCEGGVAALDGRTGQLIWRYWTNDTIFTVQCTSDLNQDGFSDCLAIGLEGTLAAIDSRNGSLIWQRFYNKMDVLVANFVPDLNNDTVDDILSSHTSLVDQKGHILVISGKTGAEIKRFSMDNGAKTFFMPQIFGNWALFGSGGPKSPGNLSVANFKDIKTDKLSFRTIYEDRFKGAITQAVFADLNNDNVPDIVTAMYNSTVVAIDGQNFSQIWNFTRPNAETNIVPTPGYFNSDDVPDFLIIYQEYDNFLNYNYTTTFILDGRTGKPIYAEPISYSLNSQPGGLTISMESHGFDLFLFWTSECNMEKDDNKNAKSKPALEDYNDATKDLCQTRYNSTNILKLKALNLYTDPPGFEIYNSIKKDVNHPNTTKSALRQVKDYIATHPKQFTTSPVGQSEFEEPYSNDQDINVHKYGSNFRHKDVDIPIDNENRLAYMPNESIDTEYEPSNLDEQEYDDKNPPIFKEGNLFGHRDPRSKKTDESDDGIYNYKNVKMSRNRLLHDLNNLPSEILRDTFFKNRENQLRRSKFEQRDINSHIDKMKENDEVKQMIEKEKVAAENSSYTLWDLESEKELQDRENGYYRGKRQTDYSRNGFQKVTSVGAVSDAFNSTTNNSIDVIFITYWQPAISSSQDLMNDELSDCVEMKLASALKAENDQRRLFMNECLMEQQAVKNNFAYFNNLYLLRLGQLSVYRIRVQCVCSADKESEKCADVLSGEKQNWATFLGKQGDGVFYKRN